MTVPGKGGRPVKYTPEYIADIGKKLLEFARRPLRKDENDMWTDICIEDFCVEENLYYRRLTEMAEKDELFSQAYKEAKRLVGRKREKIALNKGLDSSFSLKTHALYNPEYKELISWLKESEQNISKSMGAIKEFIEACKDKK